MDLDKSMNSFEIKNKLPDYLLVNFFYQFLNHFSELLRKINYLDALITVNLLKIVVVLLCIEILIELNFGYEFTCHAS